MTVESGSARNVVVVGGAGFLGQRLVELLVGRRGEGRFADQWPWFDAIHVADLVPYREPEAQRLLREQSGQTLTHGVLDVRRRDELVTAFRGAHTVFHLASIVDVGLRRNPLIEAVNVGGVRNVVEAAREAGVRCLVYTSSEDVVLSETPVAGGDERLPYPARPVHDYVRTKIEGEKLALAANSEALATCAIRPVHLYGPRDPHAIKVSLRAFRSGEVPFRLGDGRARFDVVYVDNVAHAHLLAARKLESPSSRVGVAGEAFIVGEDNAPNYFDFLEPYAACKGIRMPRARLPEPALAWLASGMEWFHRLTGRDVPFHRFHLYVIGRDFYFSHRKAAERLGYRPLVSPTEGERLTVEWLRGESLD